MTVSVGSASVGVNLQLRVLSEEEGCLHIECAGDVDLAVLPAGEEPLAKWLGAEMYSRRVRVDFDRVQFLDTSGINWFIRWQKKFVENGGLLVLHSIPPLAGEVINLLRLNRVFHIQPDWATARAFALRTKP